VQRRVGQERPQPPEPVLRRCDDDLLRIRQPLEQLGRQRQGFRLEAWSHDRAELGEHAFIGVGAGLRHAFRLTLLLEFHGVGLVGLVLRGAGMRRRRQQVQQVHLGGGKVGPAPGEGRGGEQQRCERKAKQVAQMHSPTVGGSQGVDSEPIR
jgi:hypothetical protein